MSEQTKQCWICFAQEEDDPLASWVRPCRCKGATKWGHQFCIQKWIDQKQKNSNEQALECPLCSTPYNILFPSVPLLVTLLDTSDKYLFKLCPFVAGGICVVIVYWAAVTFGAITIVQCVGEETCIKYFNKTDPLILLVTLPLIPVGIFIGKLIHWDEPVIKFLRWAVPLIPFCSYLMPAFSQQKVESATGIVQNSSYPTTSHSISLTRMIVGAFFLPTFASFIGATFFKNMVKPQWLRTLLGGLSYIGIKGVLKVYQKQHTHLKFMQRVILDFPE